METSPQLRGARLSEAREAFLEGEPLPSTLLTPAVARSWERSRTAGLRPSDAPEYAPLVTTRSRREARDDRRLHACVIDEIEQLWEAFGGNDWSIFCVNTSGVVIHARKSPWCNDDVLRPITAGRRVGEAEIGTTAPSCVLHDNTDVVVAGSEHFLSEFADVFCMAVPLVGLQGEVIGALDITGKGERDIGQVREQFRLAALAAEQRLFETLRDCHLLRVHHDPRWLGTPLAGVVAIGDDGEVRAASRTARRMLSLPLATPLPPQSMHDLFAQAAPAQFQRLLVPARAAQRIAREDGSHVWVQHARKPLVMARTRATATSIAPGVPLSADGLAQAPSAAPQAGDDASLKEQTLAAIGRVVKEYGGNIAAAARQLGISRTTLYAKLQQLRQAGMFDGVTAQRQGDSSADVSSESNFPLNEFGENSPEDN